jgi:hypothetical protein
LIQTKEVYVVKLQSEPCSMHAGMAKPLANLSSQLCRWLEGKAITVGDILEMATPSEYFSDGNLVHSLSEATKKQCLLNTSFSVWGGFFFHQLEPKRS